ncbi:MAG: gliding motility-associated C-terminal domain-containing protein, partial [Flavobacteriales bacterium]
IEPTNPQYCEGDSMLLTLSGADNYDWIPADGLNVVDGPTAWVSPEVTTVYNVIASTEECIDTVDVTVTVIPYPVITVNPEYITTCNEQVTLTATGAFQLQWTPNESLTGNGYGPIQYANPTETTVYTVVGTNSGCSSEATVTVAYQLETESTEYYCEGGSYSLPDGSEVSEEGTYIANYVSIEGCDSIVTVNLLEQSTYDFQMPVQLCAGESFTLPDGSIIAEPGTYPVILETANAQCDSTITTVVTMLQPFQTENTLALCEGDPVTLGDGTVVTEPGVYTVVLTSETNGCDSTVTSTVIFQPNYDVSVELSECDDGSYLFPDGTLPTNSGTFNFDLQTTLGCDSAVTIDLTLNPAYTINYSDAICAGESYIMPDGTSISTEGPYTSNLQTIAGCDSAITVQLVVYPLPDVSSGAEDSYCLYDGNIALSPSPAGGSLSGDLLSGQTLQHEGASPGTYEVSYSITDNNGCTNVDVVNYVLANPITPTFDFEMICNELELISTVADPNESYDYEWFLQGELIALFSNPTYYFNQSGTFDLGLTVTDEYGCNYSTTQQVLLQNALNLDGFFVPNVFTPNGDDYNEAFIIPTAVSACLNYELKVFNRWGQQVYHMTPQKASFRGEDENGTELPEGVYYYTMEIAEYPCSETPELQPYCSGSISLFRN